MFRTFAILLMAFALQTASWHVTVAQEIELERDSVERDYADQLPRIPAVEPDDALAKFSIQPGFRIELAAHEPIINDPVAMAFDDRGRLFVVCMQGYSEHRDDDLGTVRLLTDQDNDGVFDHSSTYLKGLHWPTAIACHDGGVFVGAAPDILYCKDTDDDGVADEHRVVFTGFRHQNVQGMLNSFRWGLDNRLYGAAGLNGGEITRPDDPDWRLVIKGRDFSIDPKAMTMRPESGGAQHGATFDRWGERFVCSNSDHIQWVEFDDEVLSKNPLNRGYRGRRSIAVEGPAAEVFRTSAVEPWRIVRTRLRVKGMVGGPVEGGGRAAGYFTSASGVTVYAGDAFPTKYQQGDFLFVGDVGSNLVHLKRIATDGLNKRAQRATPDRTEFLTSTDNWFRPVQFANGPDGALYVVDMYRETIEHPLSLPPMIKKHLDLNSGRERGRIYRVCTHDWQRSMPALPSEMSDRELVEMLGHKNGWHRETAARLTIERAETSESRRKRIVDELQKACAATQPLQRLRALYCLATLDGVSNAILLAQLDDVHPQVRRHALKVAKVTANQSEAVRNRLLSMLDDEDVAVRYQLAITLGELAPSVRRNPLVELARRTSDSKMRFAILSSVGNDRIATLAALLDAEPEANGTSLAQELVRQIGLSRTNVGQAMSTIATQSIETRQQFIGDLLLGTKLRGRELLQFLTEQDVANAAEVIQKQIEHALPIASDSKAAMDKRLAAISRLSLGGLGDSVDTLRGLLSPREPAIVRDAAAEQVASFSEPLAAEVLIESVVSLSPQTRRKALAALAARPKWAALLLNAIASGVLPESQIPSQLRQNLMRHRDKKTAALAKQTFGDTLDREAVVREYARVLDGRGDIERGAVLFRKVCASCHRLDNHGSQVGPDLEPLRNRGAQFMLSNILDPNREIDARYEGYTVVTNDGRVLSGIVKQDSANSLTLLQADAKEATIPKSDIDEFTATGRSLMPDGLERELTKQGLADVIAFLVEPQ